MEQDKMYDGWLSLTAASKDGILLDGTKVPLRVTVGKIENDFATIHISIAVRKHNLDTILAGLRRDITDDKMPSLELQVPTLVEQA